MARRITQSDKAVEPELVEEGGDWVKIRPGLKLGEFYQIAQGDQTQTEVTRRLLVAMIVDWSFTYRPEPAEGQAPNDVEPVKLPITYENVVDNEDALVIYAAAAKVNNSPFLTQVLALTSRGNS